MNAEDQIRNLNQIPPLSKEERRKKIMTSIVLTMATLISVLFLVYAFMQKQEADKQRAMVVEAKMEADHQREEAVKMRLTAEYAKMEAEKQRDLAVEALAACEKSKKK
jgi:C4-dicarboxylate-specific signal transduction histidine kinase